MIKLIEGAAAGGRRRAGRVTVAVIAPLVAAIMTVAAPGRAMAQPATTMVDLSTLLCLDSNYHGDAYTGPCNGGNYQRWELNPASYPNGYTIVDAQTQRCLDSNTSGSLYTLPCNGGNFQVWVMSDGPSPNTFRDLSTGFCLDSNANDSAYTLGCNGGNYQRWQHS